MRARTMVLVFRRIEDISVMREKHTGPIVQPYTNVYKRYWIAIPHCAGLFVDDMNAVEPIEMRRRSRAIHP